jgi:hypothetical protein
MTKDDLKARWHQYNPALLEHENLDELIDEAYQLGYQTGQLRLQALREAADALALATTTEYGPRGPRVSCAVVFLDDLRTALIACKE